MDSGSGMDMGMGIELELTRSVEPEWALCMARALAWVLEWQPS